MGRLVQQGVILPHLDRILFITQKPLARFPRPQQAPTLLQNTPRKWGPLPSAVSRQTRPIVLSCSLLIFWLTYFPVSPVTVTHVGEEAVRLIVLQPRLVKQLAVNRERQHYKPTELNRTLVVAPPLRANVAFKAIPREVEAVLHPAFVG